MEQPGERIRRRKNNSVSKQDDIQTDRAPADSLHSMVGASGHTRCWRLKHFGSQKAQDDWCENHKHKNQIVPVFVNNGNAVEYRSLIKL